MVHIGEKKTKKQKTVYGKSIQYVSSTQEVLLFKEKKLTSVGHT